MMKIVCVNRQYFFTGGPEKYMFNLEKNLKSIQFIPFCVDFNKNRNTQYKSYFLKPPGGGDNVYFRDFKLSNFGKIKYLLNTIYNINARKKLEVLIQEEKPDLALFLNATFFSNSIIDACKKFNVPIVWRLSDFNLICPSYLLLREGKICEECINNGLQSAIKHRCSGYQKSLIGATAKTLSLALSKWRKQFEYINYYITPSQFTRKKMLLSGFPPDKVIHLPTYINYPEEDIQLSTDKTMHLLYVGRISPEKGLETLIGALKHLNNKKFVLSIAGDSESVYAKKIISDIPEELCKKVIFMGHQNQTKIVDLYKKSDIVIVPSICYENMPNVVLEAMSHGKPVVATRLGSLLELISEGNNGLLYSPGDEKDLSDKLNNLIDSQSLRIKMGKMAKKYVRKNHNMADHLKKLSDIFSECIKLK
ncbi:MAG: glycosyltransferase [Desulfobacula sp.]|nr:glycosyltransferase [Desulfobacula sp.]